LGDIRLEAVYGDAGVDGSVDAIDAAIEPNLLHVPGDIRLEHATGLADSVDAIGENE
jgi:hypothetical protein